MVPTLYGSATIQRRFRGFNLTSTRDVYQDDKGSAVSSGVAFLFALNLLVGNGFLAIPFAFYHVGIWLGIISLILVAIISSLTAIWTLEVMSRAQGLEYNKRRKVTYLDAPMSDEISEANQDTTSNDEFKRSYRRPLPIYEVLPSRKFEFSELCEIFLGKCFQKLYVVALVFYMTFVCWSYATVVGSVWSSVIPWSPSYSRIGCSADDFKNVYLPANDECRQAYWFYTAIFGILVIPLGCFELRRQKVVQVITAVLRLLSIFLMTVQTCYEIANSDTVFTLENNTDYTNGTLPWGNSTKPSSNIGVFSYDPMNFNLFGWLWCIPVFIHAQIMQQAIPAISYQVKRPEKLGKIFLSAFSASCVINIVFGSTLALHLRGYTNENIVLNWVGQRSSKSFMLSAIAYIALLLPSLELISLFPIFAVTLANNIFVCIWKIDTSVSVAYLSNAKLKAVAIRVAVAVLPIIGAMFIANIFYIATYAGIAGIATAYVFPAVLQYKSRLQCKKLFVRSDVDRRTETADEWKSFHEHLGLDNKSTCCLYYVIEGIKKLIRTEKDTPYSCICSSNWCVTIVIILVVVCVLCSFLSYFFYSGLFS